MPVTIGIVGNIYPCAEAVNHGVQKVVGEPQTHTFLLAAEHSDVLLCVGFHVDLGELHVALSWFIQNLNTLHTIQAKIDGAASLSIPSKYIVVTIVDDQLTL